ncbi:MAG: hypothetical protein JWM89_1834 [Acidimicrobiales bacterium]|nr:hypothetical protein [Acidimicrobiales bacterium]
MTAPSIDPDEAEQLAAQLQALADKLDAQAAGLRASAGGLLERAGREATASIQRPDEGPPPGPAGSPTPEVAAGWERHQWIAYVVECGWSVPKALAELRRRAERDLDQVVTLQDLTGSPTLGGLMLAMLTEAPPR